MDTKKKEKEKKEDFALLVHELTTLLSVFQQEITSIPLVLIPRA